VVAIIEVNDAIAALPTAARSRGSRCTNGSERTRNAKRGLPVATSNAAIIAALGLAWVVARRRSAC
jgi:hypothetical protein